MAFTFWNALNVASNGLLAIGSGCHFVGATNGVRTAGALGVALKCFGMVDYLRSFQATGSLVRMISVRDIWSATACEKYLANLANCG